MASDLLMLKSREERVRREARLRRSQLRGLLLLAFAVIAFSILRAGVHTVFPAGWWRLW